MSATEDEAKPRTRVIKVPVQQSEPRTRVIKVGVRQPKPPRAKPRKPR